MTGSDRNTFTNQGQPRTEPLPGGNPHCETITAEIPKIASDQKFPSMSLLLMRKYTHHDALRYRQAMGMGEPMAWVENGNFENSEQVMAYIADVVALLQRYRRENHLQSINLFSGLPFSVQPLLGLNLQHVIGNIIFYLNSAIR